MGFGKQELFIVLTAIFVVLVSSTMVLFKGLQAGLLAGGMVIALAMAFRYPRLGLWGLLIYLPFAGTVSYSFADIYRAVGGYVQYRTDYFLFHVAKDAFYIPALIGVVFTTPTVFKLYKYNKKLVWAALGFLGMCLLTLVIVNGGQQLNATPPEKPFLMGIIGLKVVASYIPLVLCGYYFIRNQKDVLFLNRLHVILALVCCGLCFIQYLSLLNGVCDGNVGLSGPAATRATLQARCFVGGSLLYNPEKDLIRLPGTFVAPWQWGWFLIANAFLVYGAYIKETSRLWRIVSLATIVSLLLACLISGQRVALLLVPVILVILFSVTEKNKKRLPIKLGILFGVGLLVTAIAEILQQTMTDFIARWNYAPPTEFMYNQFQWIFNGELELLGNGLGRASSPARKLGEIKLIETFYVKLLYENGILGVIAFLALVSILTFLGYQAYRALKNSDYSWRSFGLCLWIFVLFISYNPYYYPLAVDPVNVYYWFFAGVLLKLPELEGQRGIKQGGKEDEVLSDSSELGVRS